MNPEIWPQLIAGLEATGMKRCEIAKKAGRDKGSVSRWAQGLCKPNIEPGLALLKLAQERGVNTAVV